MKKQELRKLIKENITDWLSERNIPETEEAPVKEKKITIEDQIAEFYYVTKPTKESSVEELIKSGDVFEFALSGLTKEDVHGIYKSEGKAKTVANKLIKERDLQLKKPIKKVKTNLSKWKLQLTRLKVKLKVKCLKPLLTQICVKHLHLNLTV